MSASAPYLEGVTGVGQTRQRELFDFSSSHALSMHGMKLKT